MIVMLAMCTQLAVHRVKMTEWDLIAIIVCIVVHKKRQRKNLIPCNSIVYM